MNLFWIWFTEGTRHILDLQGYDHILFVTLLVFAFPFAEWTKLLILITAFTLGHSISLACSTVFNIVIHQQLVEFLIALSILATSVYEFFNKKVNDKKSLVFIYAITTGFGLIHGLGFSFLLRSLLGGEQNVFLPLLYFNLGLELGQLIIVTMVLVFSLILNFVFKCPYKIYKLTTLCLIGIIALKITAERFLELLHAV